MQDGVEGLAWGPEKGEVRTLLESCSWDPKTWTPWEESDSEEGDSKAEVVTDCPQVQPSTQRQGWEEL